MLNFIWKEIKKGFKERLDFMWWMLHQWWYWTTVVVLTVIAMWYELR